MLMMIHQKNPTTQKIIFVYFFNCAKLKFSFNWEIYPFVGFLLGLRSSYILFYYYWCTINFLTTGFFKAFPSFSPSVPMDSWNWIISWTLAHAEVSYEFGSDRPFVRSESKISELAHQFLIFCMKLEIHCKAKGRISKRVMSSFPKKRTFLTP